MKTIHDEIEEWLAADVHGQLSTAEEAELRQHLAECPVCRELHAEEIKMNQLLEQTLAEEKPDPAFEQRMVSDFRKKIPARRSGTIPFFMNLLRMRSAQITAVAAVLLTLVQVGRMVTHEGGTEDLGRTATAEFKPTRERSDRDSKSLGNVSPLAKFDDASEKDKRRIVTRSHVPTDQLASAAGGIQAPPPAQEGFDVPADVERTKSAAVAEAESAAPTNAAKKESRDNATPSTVAAADSRKLIRNAQIELTIVAYDAALQSITTFAREARGYIATNASSKLANGKLAGTVVVKVAPDNLDGFLLKVRGLGELKNQTLGTDDVTKAYFDTESRMKNARVMEERLIDMLKTKTGKVSDLLQVEKELGRVREEIEKMQGELKYYDALVQFATVTISLAEKDLEEPAAFLLKETANLALFAADVEKTFGEVKNAVIGTKTQIVQSNLDRDNSGQATARLSVLIAPEESDAFIARIKGMGRVQNFNVQTQRIAQNGSGGSETAKVERDKVVLNVVIARDEQEQPVQQTSLRILTSQVPEKVNQLKAAAKTANGEIRTSTFSRDPDGQEVANITLRVPMKNYAGLIATFNKFGKVKDLSVQRQDRTGMNGNEETAPAEISVQVYSQGQIVSDNTGITATIRRTLGQGASALMWSLRMIGVALAFLAPWALALALIAWGVARLARMRARK
jgi:Domain of unknown function (DUF4349)/Putative zinc-finger